MTTEGTEGLPSMDVDLTVVDASPKPQKSRRTKRAALLNRTQPDSEASPLETKGSEVHSEEAVVASVMEDATEEAQLASSIKDLWAKHAKRFDSARKTRSELKDIRTKLGAQLHSLKVLLGKPGCTSEWPDKLRELNIAKTTAERYVKGHLAAVTPALSIESSGADSSTPDEVTVRKMGRRIAGSLPQKLNTTEVVSHFLDEMRTVLTSALEDEKRLNVNVTE